MPQPVEPPPDRPPNGTASPRAPEPQQPPDPLAAPSRPDDAPAPAYDAILITSFGGPEGMADVMPFLEHVTRGRGIPRERLAGVAHHYALFGGVSPINAQNRALVAALEAELAANGPHVPVYWGNRNWHPFLTDTIGRMRDDGIRHAAAFVTSAYGGFSGCRQYRGDLAAARAAVGPDAPAIDKLRLFYNHPGFIRPMVDRLTSALAALDDPAGGEHRRRAASVLFTAHSVPLAMAEGSRYVDQLTEASRLVSAGAGLAGPPRLVYQSRSGPPSQPWLEPDVGDAVEALAADGVRDVVVVPIGFVSDHMEVVFDLDTELAERCAALGVRLTRVPTVGTDPAFVRMIRDLFVERQVDGAARPALGDQGASHDTCPPYCCWYAPRPAVRPGEAADALGDAGRAEPPTGSPKGSPTSSTDVATP